MLRGLVIAVQADRECFNRVYVDVIGSVESQHVRPNLMMLAMARRDRPTRKGRLLTEAAPSVNRSEGSGRSRYLIVFRSILVEDFEYLRQRSRLVGLFHRCQLSREAR